MLIYLHSNYDYPDLFRQSPNCEGKWDDLQFTTEQPDQCDFIVVINKPKNDISIKCRKGGRILIIQEPPYKKNDYLTRHFKYFDTVISGFNSSNNMNEQAMLPWHINLNYDQLKQARKENVLFKKKDKASWVTSISNMNPGHKPRLEFLDFLKKRELDIDLFGRGIHPIDDKSDGILPYKYTIAVENYSAENYWTEKIADAFLSWTMPVYYGCTNIEKYFPPGSYIQIDIHKPEEALEIIQNAIEQKLFEKNIAAIEEARTLVLEKYQFFPALTSIIKARLHADNKKINCFIPRNPATNHERLITKIKNMFA